MNDERHDSSLTDRTDAVDGDGSSLICGFGRRRRRTEETGDSLDDAIARLRQRHLSGHDNSTLICGFGDDGGSCSSAEAGDDSFEDYTRHWAYEGKLPGQGNDLAKGGRSHQQNGNHNHSSHSLELGANTSEENPDVDEIRVSPAQRLQLPEDKNFGEHYSVYTKTDDGGGGNNRPACRRVSREFLRSDSSFSVSTNDDLSMASEDAVVLMLDLPNEDDDAWQDHEQKHRAHSKICGRVYRHVPNVDYISIPTELEIEGDITHERPRDYNNMHPFPISVQVPREKSSLSQSSQTYLGTEARNFNIPVTVANTTKIPLSGFPASVSKRKSGRPQSPQEMTVNSDTEEESHKMILDVSQSVVIPTKLPQQEIHVNGGYANLMNYEAKNDVISSHVETAQARRRSNLDIIEEASKDDSHSSTCKGSSTFVRDSSGVSKSSRGTSYTDSDYIFDSEFEADGIDLDIDMMIDDVATSRSKALTGEHAKSMAKKLNKDFSVRTREIHVISLYCHFLPSFSSNTTDCLFPKVSERIAQNNVLMNEGKDEGRAAIVSRHSDTDYVKKVVYKSEAVRILIRDAISTNVLFKACSDEELNELVDVFDYKEAAAGTIIIRQGDDGDGFYVMEKGIIDVAEDGTYKTTIESICSFGEIALLYGCPRSATLRARQFCKLWYISRTAFRAITSQFKRLRLENKIESLKQVSC